MLQLSCDSHRFSTLPQSTIVVASTDASNGWSPVDAHDLSSDVRSSIRRFLSEMQCCHHIASWLDVKISLRMAVTS